ncbi:predicted protein [Bathycoccus prasinos]|uniref:Ubiquitin-like domain-containing protein n=1 Tax=Bathycoccus prasinos TaxID=41875 RepID=K8F2H9_9CHLO|nr:predicted protein [Bathycoccus prasinos]CCO66513.1 predicted protein [Bathycoccus prasinos]|eukprot:XP_007510953.1 predicted protein [Bathycoccus prasinos]
MSAPATTKGPSSSSLGEKRLLKIKVRSQDPVGEYEFSLCATTKILALKKLVETKSGVKPAEQRILCRGRLVADETSLSSAPVENNDVLLMVRKAPESATARTPEGLRNDPHAPHNRENGMRGRGSGLRSIEEVMGRAVGGGGGEAVFQRLNIPGLPPGVEVVGGMTNMMMPPNARMLGSMAFSGTNPEAFDPQRIGSMILSQIVGADRAGGGLVQPRADATGQRAEERRGRGQNTNTGTNPSSNNRTSSSSRERRPTHGLQPPRFPTDEDGFGANGSVHTQVFDTPDGPVAVEIEMGAMMPDGFPMMFSSPPRRRREDAERGTGNGAPPPAAREQNTTTTTNININNNNNNNNNSNRRNSRTNPAQTLATYAMRLDRHLAASQQQQQEQQNPQEDEHLESVVHHGVCCDACDVMPIRGARYKCTNRDDYDLCSECHSRLYGGVDRSALQFHRLVYPLPIGLMDGREISLFGDDSESDSEDFVPEAAPVFTHETTTNAVPGAASDNANANTFANGISTAQGDVDALTTALDVASRSAQRLIPQLTQLSARVRSGDIFQSAPNASSSQERRDDNAQAVINGEILELASQMHAIGALWTELARGVSSVAPAALPASAFAPSFSPASARRQSTIQYMNSIRAATAAATGAPARAAAPAGNERRTEVGNGVYTQNVSASRSFRLPRTVYLDRSSAFATVIPAMVSPATLAQMHRYTMQDPESAQPSSPPAERNDVGSFDGIRHLGWAPPPRNLPEGHQSAPSALISANTEMIRNELRERGTAEFAENFERALNQFMRDGQVVGAPSPSPPSSRATPTAPRQPTAATVARRTAQRRANANRAATAAPDATNRRRGGGSDGQREGAGANADAPAPKRTRRGG